MVSSTLRETIFRAAVDHVAEHGPDSLSFRKLAADAGVSHQAPYHHFTDRRGVFRAIALDGFTRLGESLSQALLVPADEQAQSLLEAYVEFALANPGHFRVMFRSDLCDMENAPELQAFADAAFDLLVDHVRTRLGDAASIDDIRARATAMWSIAHGFATLYIEGPLEKKIGPVADRRAFLRAVGRQTGIA